MDRIRKKLLHADIHMHLISDEAANMKKNSIIIVFLLLLLNGCASVENRTSAERFTFPEASSDDAIIILSVGAPKECISFVTHLRLLKAESPYDGKRIASLPVDSYVVKSEYSDHHGYLDVLRVSPGEYYFAPTIANPALKAKKISRADFSVSAGEIVYLGDFFLSQACGSSINGIFTDKFERDRKLLVGKNARFLTVGIKKNVLSFNAEMEPNK